MLAYNGIPIGADRFPGISRRHALSSRAKENDTETTGTTQVIITTKRLSLVEDFISQVWYGILEIKAWRKKFGVYIIDLVPVRVTPFDSVEFMKSWMEVHVKFELQA